MSANELDQWLDDFDNLVETGHFENQQIKEHVHYHEEMDMKQFLSKGREIIRQAWMYKNGSIR